MIPRRIRALVVPALLTVCAADAGANADPDVHSFFCFRPSLGVITAGPPASAASLDTIYIAIAPVDTVVTPGAVFDVHFTVTQPGLGFNAYDAVISYDPQALTFLPQPAGWQQGSLMTGACGNTFHRFQAAGDSIVINHSLLCANVSLHGPGILYNLRFRASNTPQPAHLTLRFIQFYDDGYNRGPVKLKTNTVHIGPPTDVAPVAAPQLQVEVAPNPFNPQAEVRVEFPEAGWQAVTVFDGAGRVVRTLFTGPGGAGVRNLRWNGRDDAGRPVAAGVYFVGAQTPQATRCVRAVLVK